MGSSASPAGTFKTSVQTATGLTISPSTNQTIDVNGTLQLYGTLSPADINNKKISWKSSDKTVASFSGSDTGETTTGSANQITLTGHKAGTVTITGTPSDGTAAHKKTIEVTVRNPLNSLTLSPDSTITISKGGFTATVTATTDPASYDASNISWDLPTNSYVTMSVSGKTATLTSTSTAGGPVTLTVSAGGITKTVSITTVAFTTQTWNAEGAYSKELPAGTYKLEVWGAEGGSAFYNCTQDRGGKGGYSYGNIKFDTNTTLHIVIGGSGKIASTCSESMVLTGGYNGGGNGQGSNYDNCGSGGGGATHIATQSGLLKNVSSSNLLIVAGGGGGASTRQDGTTTFSYNAGHRWRNHRWNRFWK